MTVRQVELGEQEARVCVTMPTQVRPLATIPSLAKLVVATAGKEDGRGGGSGEKRTQDGVVKSPDGLDPMDAEGAPLPAPPPPDAPPPEAGGMDTDPTPSPVENWQTRLLELKAKRAKEEEEKAERVEAAKGGGGRSKRKAAKPPERRAYADAARRGEIVPMTDADRKQMSQNELDFERVREVARLAQRKVDTFPPADLYRDMRIQSELCLLVSSETRASEDSKALAPMQYNQELDKWVPPVAVDDVDIAMPFDAWEGLQIADPTAPKQSELHSELTMYFLVDADENVDVESDSKKLSETTGVRIDPGRYRAYKEYIEENKGPKGRSEWEREEKERRMKERERVREAIIHRRKKQIERYKENAKSRYFRDKGDAATQEEWEALAKAREAEWNLETARDAQAAQMLKDGKGDYFGDGKSPSEEEWQRVALPELTERIKLDTENLVVPPPIDPEAADPPIIRNEELLQATGSRIDTFNQGQPPSFTSVVGGSDGAYRQYLRNHLYKFGINADYWYQTESHPHPAKGVVCFKYNAMLLQDRKLGHVPVATHGMFLRRCNVKTDVVDREERTGRPLTHEGHTPQTCPNWAKYIRACRYRMEVARLWYKLFLNQPPEIISRMLAESGVVDQFADDKRFSAIKKTVTGRRKAVLAVIEFGGKGTLRLPSILPSYKAKTMNDGSGTIVYEIENAAKFESELRSDEPEVPEVQERGNYTWPIQKIDKTTAWLRFVENLEDRNIFTLALMDALFQEDLATTWDWFPGAIPEKVKRIFLNPDQPVEEFDEAYAYEEMEFVFESLIEAMPLWAQAFLSTELVDDTLWEGTTDPMIDILSQEKAGLKRAMAESSEQLRKKELAVGLVREQMTDTGISPEERKRKMNALESLMEQNTVASLEYWKALVKLNTLVRDNVFASFEWNGYASNSAYRRDATDADQDSGVRTSWAKTQLYRCCYEIDTFPVAGEGMFPAPPDHVPFRYFIGPERTSGTTVKIGMRGFDRKVLVPGEPGLDLWYSSWYIETVQRRGVGNIGQLVTLQNMFKYVQSKVNPQYVQTQGQWGVIEAITTVTGSWLPVTYRVRVLSYIFDEVYDNDEVDGKIDDKGHPIVEVTGEHIWPLKWDFRMRYGDVVAPVLVNPDGSAMSAENKAEIDGERYAVTKYLWLAPSTFSNQTLISAAESMRGGKESVAYATASARGDIEVTEWEPKTDITMKDGKAYRNTKSFIFHAPNEKPEGTMRRPPATGKPPLQLPDTMQRLYSRVVDDDATYTDNPSQFTAIGRVLRQYGTRIVHSGVAYFNMDGFQDGPPDDFAGFKAKATVSSRLSDDERRKLLGESSAEAATGDVDMDEGLAQSLSNARGRAAQRDERP